MAEVEKWRVTSSAAMVAVCSEPSLEGVLDARMPGDEVSVAYREGDWVRLHVDEGFGDQAAWMLVDGTARGLGLLMEFVAMVEGKRAPVHWAEKPQVKVVVSQGEGEAELEVLVDSSATFWNVKKAIAKTLGREEVMDEMQLFGSQEDGVFVECEDYEKLLDMRHLLALNVDFADCVVQAAVSRTSATEQFANLARSRGMQGKALSKDSTKGSPKGYSKGSPNHLSKGRGKPAGQTSAMTKRDAISLQRELYLGFREDELQVQLQSLRDNFDPDTPEYVIARQRLFLSVQAPILPKYGFEGSLSGIFKMMRAMQPFINDPDFAPLAAAINELMDIDLPPEAWSNLTLALNERIS